MSHLRLVPAATASGGFVPSPQQEAIFHFVQSGTGHGLVIARAGTGKTTTIVHALSYVPEDARVLCCAFNTRIRDVLLEKVPKDVRVRTLHQLGRDIMFSWRAFKGFQHDEDDEKGKDMAVLALRGSRFEQALSEFEKDTPEHKDARVVYTGVRDAIEAAARLVKATLTKTRPDLLELLDEHDIRAPDIEDQNELAELTAKAVKAAADAWPRTDFDDEVWLPVLHNLTMRKYDFVFIDEAQDLTLSQMRLALAAVREGGRVIAVGDPAQAIYRWRGADKDPFGRLRAELNAVEFPLSVSYRCPRTVVQLAQQHVKEFEAHPSAPPGTVTSIQLVDMLLTVRPGDFILSRTNAPLAVVGLDLSGKVPCKVLGSQDIGKLLANLVRRSRKKTVEALLEWLATYLQKETERLTKKGAVGMSLTLLEDKISTIQEFCEGETETQTVAAKIEQFFIEQHRGKPAVILSTVHRLKGDEANRVFVLEETFYNKRGDPLEEANIHYVAITRAKSQLFLVRGLYAKKKGAAPPEV